MTQAVEQPDVQLRPGTWNVDTLHSQFLVSVVHMSFAHLGAKFPRISGKLVVDPANPLASTFELEVETRSVTTGHAAQEDFMRGEYWLDAENHPAISFKGTSIVPQGGSRFLVGGDLTLRGVTRPVEIAGDFHGVIADMWGLRAAFVSTFTIDRRDFGITWNREFDWGLMAGWELAVSLDIELAYPDESLAQKPKA